MAVKYSPQDRVVVTNFRMNPSSTITIFDLAYIKDNLSSVADGGVLTWDAAQNSFVTKPITLGSSSYDANGNVGDFSLIPRLSYTETAPVTLAAGELAYSLFPERVQNGALNGGMTLYVGDENGNPVAISSQATYEYLNHQPGITTANSALLVGANKDVDRLTIGNIYFSDSTLAVTNAFADLRLAPGGSANINATGHRITDVANPIAPQDAATKGYIDTALANYAVAPVTISNLSPAKPDHGDLWYDADETFRLYVWNEPTKSWVDASPSVAQKATGLVVIANAPPVNPEVGQAWYDADNTGRTFVWDSVQWVDMNPQAVAPDVTHVTVADTPPSLPNQGDLWYDSRDTYRLYVWDNPAKTWIDASPNAGDKGPHVTVATAAPIAPKQGDMWYDSNDTYRTFVWDETAAAWLDIAPNLGSAAGLITIATTPPINPVVGAAWYDEDATGRTYVWDGIQWVDIAPQADMNFIQNPSFVVDSTAPSSPVKGDAWWNTQNGEGYVWDSVGWVQINPSDIPHVTIASAPPVDPIKGDMWYDEDPMSPGAGRTYVWDSIQWVDMAPQIQPTTPQSLVIIANDPPVNPEVGQAWYDADVTGRTYVWDSVQWVDMNPQAGASRQTIVTVADSAPGGPAEGDLWYDSKNTYRMYVWDSVSFSWVDSSPTVLTSEYILLSNIDLALKPTGYTTLVPVGFKSFVVEVVGCSLTNSGALAGWVADATTASRTVQVGAVNVDVSSPTFTGTVSFDNYVDNGTTKPSTFFMNKYNENVLSIEVKTNNIADTFTGGTLKVWGIR